MPGDEKYDWIVIFKHGRHRIYTYINRTASEMEQKLGESYARSGEGPEGVWAYIDGNWARADVNYPG